MKNWKKSAVICISLTIGLAVMGAGRKPPGKEEKFLVRVNDEVLTMKEFNQMSEKTKIPTYRRDEEPVTKEEMVEQWIETELLFQEVRRRGIDQKPELLEKLEEIKRQMAIQVLLQEEISRVKVSDKEVREYFKEHQSGLGASEKIMLKHILVGTKEEAEELRKRLNKGEQFDRLAREASTDEPTREKGGDLGPVDHRFCVMKFGPSFAEAAFSLKKGEISQPVRSRRGYHLIKMEEIMASKQQSPDEVREWVETMVLEEKRKRTEENLMETLRGKADIEKHLELLYSPE